MKTKPKTVLIKMSSAIGKTQILNCEESGIVLHKEAMVAEVKKLNEIYEAFHKDAASISTGTIRSANRARELGLHLQTMCGHEHMKLSFWQSHCEGKVPFKFDAAQKFISVANKMDKPAKTLLEAVPFVQTILQAGGILMLPERTETQQRSAISVFQRVLTEITLVRAGFKKALKEKPMELWTASDHDTFQADTAWIQEERDRSVKLRHQKYREA